MTGWDFQAPPEALGLVGGVVVAALLLRLAPDLQTVFFLVPGHTTTRPWQVITAGYFEDSFLNLLLGSAALLACGVLLRPTWGGRELLRFVVLTNGVQGCLTWAGMILMYILFREEHFLFSRLGGLTGVMGGLAVALKQHVHMDAAFALPVVMGGNGPAAGQLAVHAMRHAPSLVLVWSAVLLLGTHSGPPDELLFAWNGILAAWVYLRYYQPRAAGMAGDPSSEFAFASLFPPPLEPPLRAGGAKVIIEPHRHAGVFVARGKEDVLVTRSMVPGDAVYGEKRITVEEGEGDAKKKVEYRVWNPFRSKIAAAILGGVDSIHMGPGSKVLYLGAASGTSVSHVSDLVGETGCVYAVEFSHRSGRDLINVAKKRTNIIPIIEDARHPHKYRMLVGMVDCVFADVAQPDQARIVALNAHLFLKNEGHCVISVKANCIDSTAPAEHVFAQEVVKLKAEQFKPLEQLTLEPYERDHAVVIARYRDPSDGSAAKKQKV